MIRIRYRGSNELSPGLHAAAERHRRGTTVYLLSGLTAQERRSALRRLRLSARMGHCPRLPAGQLALALLADRIRTTVGRAGAVLRLHPAGSTLPVMVLSGGAIAFLLFSTVSIHVLHHPRTADQSSASDPEPAASASAVPIPGGSQGQAAGLGGPGQGDDAQQNQPAPGGSSVANPPSLTGAGGGPDTGSGQAPGGSQAAGGAGGGGTGPSSTAAGTTVSGGGADPSTQAAGRATTPAAAASSPAAAKPAPSPGSGTSGVCVDVGSLGICLNV